MGKLIGYIIALGGLILIVLSFLKLSFLAFVNQKTILIAGVILVLVGVVLTLGKKEKQLEEVPIYRGEGKKRTVVGYRRMGK